MTKWFGRYARRNRIRPASLREAIERADRGYIDAELGGGVIKQRMAREGAGRSGGYRVLVAFHSGKRSVFLYAFAKSERDNIDPDELATLRELAATWLEADQGKLGEALRQGILEEVSDG